MLSKILKKHGLKKDGAVWWQMLAAPDKFWVENPHTVRLATSFAMPGIDIESQTAS